jgi:predicted nucleic acid-binding protein
VSELAEAVERRLWGHELHAPAHFDAEVLSPLGRLRRAGELSDAQVTTRLRGLSAAPVERHLLPDLVPGAWKLRHNLRLVDALYVELSTRLETSVVTTDAGMAAVHPTVELVVARN